MPVAVPATAEEYLAGRRALLEPRMGGGHARAAAETLEDVRIKGGEMTIKPLQAITPEAAEHAAERLYAMLPNARVTAALADATNMGLTPFLWRNPRSRPRPAGRSGSAPPTRRARA